MANNAAKKKTTSKKNTTTQRSNGKGGKKNTSAAAKKKTSVSSTPRKTTRGGSHSDHAKNAQSNNRVIAGIVCLLLALISALGYFHIEAILVEWIRTLIGGLTGWGRSPHRLSRSEGLYRCCGIPQCSPDRRIPDLSGIRLYS